MHQVFGIKGASILLVQKNRKNRIKNMKTSAKSQCEAQVVLAFFVLFMIKYS